MHHNLASFLRMDRLSDAAWPYSVLRTLPRWNLRHQQLLIVFSDFRVPISMFIWVTSYACFAETIVWQELVVVVMLYEVTTSGMTNAIGPFVSASPYVAIAIYSNFTRSCISVIFLSAEYQVCAVLHSVPCLFS